MFPLPGAYSGEKKGGGRMKKRWAAFLTAAVLAAVLFPARSWAVELPVEAQAALLMEKTTGQVLYAKNEHEQLEPASVTKVMTLLLAMEALDEGRIRYDDTVTVSAYAASMGGSQVFLSEGEQITVEDLFKAICVASGNDASVAMAEHIAGVTELFVEQMNARAKELGCTDTTFTCVHGLYDYGNVSTAEDLAKIAAACYANETDMQAANTLTYTLPATNLHQNERAITSTNLMLNPEYAYYRDYIRGMKTGFTTLAGRSTTSPAAIRSATWESSC